MPNIIQVAEDLKNAPDQWLAQQMQSPSGSAPPWLVASEVARREKLRSGASKAQAPQSSVSDDLIKSLYARIPPTAGLMGSPAPPGVPPVNLSPGSNPSTLGAAGSTPPGNFKMPARAMASGGEYDEDDGSDEEEPDPYDIYNLPMSKQSRRAQMDRLMMPPVEPQAPQPATVPQIAPVMNMAAAAAPPVTPSPAYPPTYPGPVALNKQGIERMVASTYPGSAASTKDEIARLVDAAAQRHQLPPELIRAVIQQESNWNPKAIGPKTSSGKHAIGLMQLMPETAAELGVTDQAMLFDPATNIDAGTRYLKKMLGMFNGDVNLALKAYNAGPGAVKKYKGNPPFRETTTYAANINKEFEEQRRQLGLAPPAQPANLSSRLLEPKDGETGEPEAPETAPPAAAPSPGAPQGQTSAPPYYETSPYITNLNAGQQGQPSDLRSRLLDTAAAQDEAKTQAQLVKEAEAPAATAPGVSEVTTVAPGEVETKATVKREPPLHQTWLQPEMSPQAIAIQKQIDEMQQGHISADDRLKELLSQESLDLLNSAGRSIFGPPPDYSKYSNAISEVMAMAQRNMHPSIGQGLMDWGMAMMASTSPNFLQAMGQAGAHAMQKYETMRRQGMSDFMTAIKAGVELQSKEDAYNEKIGQYKMQRLGARETGIMQDERAFRSDIAARQRQINTAQINYEKALTTPAAVNNMAIALMNRERIVFDPNGPDPIEQLAATGRKDLVDEAYLAGKTGAAGRGVTSVERTQEARANSLLTMDGIDDPWDPDENPEDAQFPNARAKIDKKYKELSGLYTTAAGANLPQQMREAQTIAEGVLNGHIDPTMSGMYGKQVLPKVILERKYHYNLAQAVQDWNAVKAYLHASNVGPANKYRRDVLFATEQVPKVRSAYKAWTEAMNREHPDWPTRFKSLNNLTLQASLDLGGQTGAIARTLVGHIAELQNTLPGIYSGGFAPHDEDLKRVKLMVDAGWDEPGFMAGLKVVDDTLRFRKNSVLLVMPFGVSENSPYTRELPGAKLAAAEKAGKVVPAENVQKYADDHPGVTFEQAKKAFEDQGYFVK